MHNPFLVGEKVYLRAIEVADAATCHTWVNDPETGFGLGMWSRPNTLERSEQWIRKGAEDPNHFAFAICRVEDDAHIGNIEVRHVNWVNGVADIGMLIGPSEARGKGHGTEALLLACRFAFDRLNLGKLWLEVSCENAAAIRCYQKAGFVRAGTRRGHWRREGRRIDVYYMELLEDEFRAAAGD